MGKQPTLPFAKQPGPHPMARMMKPKKRQPIYTRYNAFLGGWNTALRGLHNPTPAYYFPDCFWAGYNQAISGRRDPNLTEIMIKMTGDQRSAIIAGRCPQTRARHLRQWRTR